MFFCFTKQNTFHTVLLFCSSVFINQITGCYVPCLMSKRDGLYPFWFRPIPWDYFAYKSFHFLCMFLQISWSLSFWTSSIIIFALWALQQGDGVSKGHDFRAVALVKLYDSRDSDTQSLTRQNHLLVRVQPKSCFESQTNDACGMDSIHFSAHAVSSFGLITLYDSISVNLTTDWNFSIC